MSLRRFTFRCTLLTLVCMSIYGLGYTAVEAVQRHDQAIANARSKCPIGTVYVNFWHMQKAICLSGTYYGETVIAD